jgi:RNA polymerase sigma-70 factor (ECF subfamily)
MSDRGDQLDADAERALIARAQAGDGPSLERLLAVHQDRVWRTALGMMGGDSESAWEVAQEVLVSAWRHIGQFRGGARFSTWLYRMTANFVKNHRVASGRRAARFVSMDSPVGGEEDQDRPREFSDGAPSPRARAAGSEMLERLHECLGELPEEFRGVLAMRYIEDMGYEEIAEALDLPLGTVKSRINRGRRELRALMGDSLGKEERDDRA